MQQKLLLRADSRDKLFHQRFGQTVQFPPEMNFDDSGIPEEIQPAGSVKCTAYGICYDATNFTKKLYDKEQLFKRYPSDSSGADPRQALGEAVRGGLLPIGANATEKVFSSYWQAHTGDYDAFENVQRAMALSNSPCLVWTNWYYDWALYSNAIMPLGKNRSGGHCYAIIGWKEVAGEVMFVVQAWQGYTMYMPRVVFNAEIAKWGCGSAILSTVEIDAKRVETLQETIIDALKNLVLAYQALLDNLKKNKIV